MKPGYSLLPAHQETVACLLVPVHCCLPTATFLAMWLPESLPAGHCLLVPAHHCLLVPAHHYMLVPAHHYMLVPAHHCLLTTAC